MLEVNKEIHTAEVKYEIVSQGDAVLVKVSEGKKIEELDMSQPLPGSSLLVAQGRNDVLGQINLTKLLGNLDNCVDLLQITYNAVDGFGVQPQVQELSNRFIDTMNDSNQAALSFKMSAQDALESCIYAYGMLMEGDVEGALSLLADTKDTATQMVQVADKLVKAYQGLTDYTNSVLKQVMDERATDEKKREETKAMIRELEGSIQAMEAAKESLAADIRQMDEEYQELQQREIQAEKRAFGMQLASMILGTLGSLVNIPAQALGSGSQDRDAAETEVGHEAGSTEEQAKREYAQNVARQTAIAAQLKELDGELEHIDKVLDGELYQGGAKHEKADPDDPEAEKTEEALRQEKQSKVDQKAQLNQELSGLKGKETAIQETLKGLGVAVDEISQQTHSAAQEIQAKADSLAQRAREVGNKREKLKELERENLMELAQNTAKMENMVMDANALESAIQCLVIAIGCLRKVLTYLQEIKLFWMNVETFCGNLANDDKFTRMIEREKGKSLEECAKYFKSRIFVWGYLGLMAKWKALGVVFDEYHAALMEVSQRMGKAMEQPLSADRKVQWKLASQMAGELNRKLKKEINPEEETDPV